MKRVELASTDYLLNVGGFRVHDPDPEPLTLCEAEVRNGLQKENATVLCVHPPLPHCQP